MSDQEFLTIKELAERSSFIQPQQIGAVLNKKEVARAAYIEKILGFVDCTRLKPLKIVINSGNGAAGPTLNAINEKLIENGIKTNFVFVHHDPDPTFPNGIPNPLLVENRSSTADAVAKGKADFGVAFDGDFDRCFLFDDYSNFIPGEYVVGLLADIFLNREKGATIIHDPRVIWNTIDVVAKCDGQAVVSKTGHAFVKAAMRKEGNLWWRDVGASLLQDFAYCDRDDSMVAGLGIPFNI